MIMRAMRSTPEDSVDHAVVDLADHREAVVVEPLDEPELPERLSAVELLRRCCPGSPFEDSFARPAAAAAVADVVAEVEAVVVDPDRIAEDRDVGELLAEARVRTGQRAVRHCQNALHVEGAALYSFQRRRVEEPDRTDVHVRPHDPRDRGSWRRAPSGDRCVHRS